MRNLFKRFADCNRKVELQRKRSNWRTFCLLLAIEQRRNNHNKSIGLTPSLGAFDPLVEFISEEVFNRDIAIKGLRILKMMAGNFPNDELIQKQICRLEEKL